jgi:GldM C-terminal domain
MYMKRFPFFCLLFSLTFVKNALLAQSVVAASKMNILYIGVENKMRFGAVGVPLNELEVTASGTSITKCSSGNVLF